MVQMFNVGPSRSQHLKNTLGKFLNEGVGSFATGFAANKSLNKVLEDSEYKNADPSEKASRLVQALSPYGEYGKNILSQRMAIEQQKEQETQQKVLSKLFSGEELSEKERSQVPVAAQLEIFKNHQKAVQDAIKQQQKHQQQLELQRLKNQSKSIPKSEFEKTIEKKSADEFIKARDEIPKIENALENIQRQRELSSQLRGPSGSIAGLLGTKKAAEFDSLGMLNLEPIIKIFNPSGPIAQRKLEFLKDKYVPKATDLQTTIEGKINGIERLLKQAQARNQAKLDLFKQYGGSPPLEQLDNFDKESSRILDAFTSDSKQESFEDLPNAKEYKGRIITNQKTGEQMKSNGESWEQVK